MFFYVRSLAFFLLFATVTLFADGSKSSSYNPLAVSDTEHLEFLDFSVQDTTRNREIPIRIYLPIEKSSAPVVLFSHGLGGSRENNPYLGKHWSRRGYVCVFIQHIGSDESVWKEKPLGERMTSMQQAANAQNFQLRVKDVPAVLDQLEVWNKTEKHAIYKRLDLKRIGMSGHSFGAVTTQAVSGQTTARGNISFTDPRIKAAIAFSPSAPRSGQTAQAFSQVKIPWMLMTGTKDTSPIGNTGVEERLAVFPALPDGGKYELVLYDAEHSAFGERASKSNKKRTGRLIERLGVGKEKGNPNHHQVILALSTAFWDTWLQEDKNAKEWLDGDGPSSVLEEKDRWQKK